MIQVKEFLNCDEGQETAMNDWLRDNDGKIEIVGIKYSVGAFQSELRSEYSSQPFSGTLIIYKLK